MGQTQTKTVPESENVQLAVPAIPNTDTSAATAAVKAINEKQNLVMARIMPLNAKKQQGK